jgi:hypothetical protein
LLIWLLTFLCFSLTLVKYILSALLNAQKLLHVFKNILWVGCCWSFPNQLKSEYKMLSWVVWNISLEKSFSYRFPVTRLVLKLFKSFVPAHKSVVNIIKEIKIIGSKCFVFESEVQIFTNLFVLCDYLKCIAQHAKNYTVIYKFRLSLLQVNFFQPPIIFNKKYSGKDIWFRIHKTRLY